MAGMAAGELPRVRRAAPARNPLTKVPEVTVFFWVTKVVTTGMGEATSDYLVHRFNPEIAVVLGFVAFVAAMILQFAVRRYVTWIYWLAVVMVAVFGTMAADVLHVGLHVPYWASTAFYAVVLAAIFMIWHRSEGTLSIHSICTRRRETFYWATVLATFALGTAAGDWTAKSVGLGYLGSGVMFAVVIAIPAVGYWRFRLNAIVAFWFAYIVTRPLGASFADWLAWPHSASGLGLGHAVVAGCSTIIIAGLVAFMTVTRHDVADRGAGSGRPAASGADLRPEADHRPSRAGRHRRVDAADPDGGAGRRAGNAADNRW